MIGERIKRARAAAGLSQRQAAKRAGLSAMAISKFERGESTPTSGTLIRVAKALEAPMEFFFRPDTVTLGKPEYRKRSSLGKKQLARVEADVLDQVERFLELLSLFPKSPVRPFVAPKKMPRKVKSLDDVEDVAILVRDAWKLGRSGIASVADVLEAHGIFVLTTVIDSAKKFDGLAAHVNSYPIVVVGAHWTGDRQRFTLAHELGHLVLKGRLSDGLMEEAASNRFAAAFLVPKDAVIFELGSRRNHMEPRELHQLKQEYGLSMFAWVLRARDVGVITQGIAESLMRMFSASGWRKKEPGESYRSEKPHLFEQLVVHAFAEGMISMSKAAELMSISLWQFRDRLNIESSHGAAHQ